MFDYIINHAIANVWCTPNQDNQVILRPGRLTATGGVVNVIRMPWQTLTLPEPSVRFHVYQIGQIHPILLSLAGAPGVWVKLSEICNTTNLICDLYTAKGIQLPRTQTWYMLAPDNNLVIAVKKNTKVAYDFNAEAVYLRVYKNAYFASDRSVALVDYVNVQGGIMSSISDILALQTAYNAKALLPGKVYAFVNGYKRPNISLITVSPGDVAEFVYDSSILRIEDYSLSSLRSFDSVLDTKSKYLIHPPGVDLGTIEYLDDLDMFLVNAVTGVGVYVHKNASDTIRMLTHRDYSVVANYINAYLPIFAAPLTSVVDVQNISLRFHIRKSGYLRPLILEGSRINELYKLSSDDIVDAMVGISSTVPVWRAVALEQAGYPQVMRANCCDITGEMVQNAYGYNAVSKLIADTPKEAPVVALLHTVQVPYALMFDCTVFEYDVNGLLLGWYRHTGGANYPCVNSTTRYVEMITGEGSRTLDESYELSSVVRDPKLSYRLYKCPIALGVPTNEWVDVTGTTQYTQSPSLFTWLPDPAGYTLVRSDKKFLLYELSLPVDNGILSFHISNNQLRGVVTAIRDTDIPLGDLDVFLNGHSLIRGLDYVMDFPAIVITNKEYLVSPNTQPQSIVIRSTGFCDSSFAMAQENEFGFIQHGRISVNQRFDIHDGKVQRIISGGRLKIKSELVFSEKNNVYNFLDSENGKPYLIRDILVPMRGLVNQDTYAYKQIAKAVDQSVSDYLTLKIPETGPTTVNPIASRHTLYSPFISKIIFDLIENNIDSLLIPQHYDDDFVRSICAPSEYLLQFDPIQIGNYYNNDYTVVHPHLLGTIINLDLVRYRFLNNVVRMYANNRVSLSGFVMLVS